MGQTVIIKVEVDSCYENGQPGEFGDLFIFGTNFEPPQPCTAVVHKVTLETGRPVSEHRDS
jgi:hypothetical protein